MKRVKSLYDIWKPGTRMYIEDAIRLVVAVYGAERLQHILKTTKSSELLELVLKIRFAMEKHEGIRV